MLDQAQTMAEADAPPLLQVSGLEVSFGGVQALRGASLSVKRGQIVGLIGPNGAGKTTLFNCISGFIKPHAGSIDLNGNTLLKVPPHSIAAAGVCRTFQNRGLYPEQTVLNNVKLGAYGRLGGGFFAALLRPLGERERERQANTLAMASLEALGLAPMAHQTVAGLPFGALKRVEIARALMAHPRLLMLDEPGGGLNASELDELAALLKQLVAERGITLLVVEHRMRLVMALCDAVTVLHLGTTLASGTVAEVLADARVKQAYFGKS